MLTVVWDVDDVLNNLMQAWFSEEWKPSHPECRQDYSDITENPPDRVLGITRSEYLASLDAFRLSDRARDMQPNPAVLEWLWHCGPRYRHMALTARPLSTVPPLAEWLFRHFGGYLRSFGVVPTRLDPGIPIYDHDKGEFLSWFGNAGLLVDDSEENLSAAGKFGVRGLRYPQPWNQSTDTVHETLQRLSQLAEAN